MSPERLSPADIEDGWTFDRKPVETPNPYELAARAKLGVSDAWRWFEMKVMDDDITRVRGAIPLGIKANGFPKWPSMKLSQTTYVTKAQVAAARHAWEQEHNACASCGGDGRELAGVSEVKGWRYRECTKCGGSGKPQAVAP